jgi:hypothetical protein
LTEAIQKSLDRNSAAGRAVVVKDPVFAGSDGSLAIARDASEREWEKLSLVIRRRRGSLELQLRQHRRAMIKRRLNHRATDAVSYGRIGFPIWSFSLLAPPWGC